MKPLICYFITGRWKKIIEWLLIEYCNLIHSLLYLIFLTLPPTPSLKLKGRDGDGLRTSKEELGDTK
jgi:hypothetical protein